MAFPLVSTSGVHSADTTPISSRGIGLDQSRPGNCCVTPGPRLPLSSAHPPFPAAHKGGGRPVFWLSRLISGQGRGAHARPAAFKMPSKGAWAARRLSVGPRLSSGSRGPGIEPHLRGGRFSLSLCSPCSCSHVLSQVNILKKKPSRPPFLQPTPWSCAELASARVGRPQPRRVGRGPARSCQQGGASRRGGGRGQTAGSCGGGWLRMPCPDVRSPPRARRQLQQPGESGPPPLGVSGCGQLGGGRGLLWAQPPSDLALSCGEPPRAAGAGGAPPEGGD